MSCTKIVVWDPHGSWNEGQVLQDGENVRRAELMRGLVTLPYEPSLRELGAVGGYARRGFGEGEYFDKSEQRRGCSLLVAASQDATRLHCVARVTHLDRVDGARNVLFDPPLGNLRLCPVPNTVSTSACSAVPLEGPVELAGLGMADKYGGWTVRGMAALSCPMAGYVSVGLMGIAQKLCVLWLAASVTRGS